jgi:DNA gyrase subunit A
MEKQIITPIDEELQASYVDYAMSVIIGRAIPDARDGLKPVQRRILYAMYNLKNLHNQPTKKSARIVGETIGKYHPHGDTAVYDAMVRMAQGFSMHHTLVEGQGNFGSIDGDPPAAQRYTEVRLTKIAEEMLEDLDKGTADFIPNFDNTEEEPLILPSKIPNLLVNGSSGIAVGVATSMPPHNLSEVCDAIIKYLESAVTTADDLLEIVKGPDFPTGGIAIMSQSAYDGYRHGRGQIRVRAKADTSSENRIVITEVPYNTNKASIVQAIAILVKDKRINGIKDLRDESDKGGIRIVIDLKENFDPDQILNQLYKHTQLENTLPIINLAVVGKSLRNLNILQMISVFVEHRKDVILRRSKYELNMATERQHIVQGLLIAIEKIDDIIRDIKASKEVKDAREKLITTHSLTIKQADAILDMKLSRLTHLESDTLKIESDELGRKIEYYSGVISDPEKIKGIIRSETEEIKKLYSKPRKTEIIKSEDESAFMIKDEDMISDEPVTLILTKEGYVKRMATTIYKEQARGGKGVISINLKDGDYVNQVIACNNKDYVLSISNKGRVYWLKAYNVPESSRYSEGKAIVNLLNITDEKIIGLLDIKGFENSNLVFLTRKGLVKKVRADLFSKPRSSGVRAITLAQGDEIVDVVSYRDKKYLVIATAKGKAIKFNDNDLRFIGRTAMGVRGIRLKDDVPRNILAVDDSTKLMTVTENGYGKVTPINKYRTQKRGGKGIANLRTNQKTGNVSKALSLSDEPHLLLINNRGISITIPVSSIRETGRATSGVRLMKLDSGSKIADAKLIY